MILVYHCTTLKAARAILEDGFIAHARGPFGDGVWVSRVPLTVNDGARGNEAIEVALDITEEEFLQYAVIEDETLDPETGEWVKDEGFEPYEWLLPEDVANSGTRRLLADDEAWERRYAADA